MNKFFGCRVRGGMIFLLLFIVIANSGCETFRKKLSRKKKTDIVDNQATAILDPIEYQAVIKTAAQLYQEHYSLWKVWQSDLENIIEDKTNERKLRYTVGQIREQLGQMQKLLVAASQAKMDEYLQELDRIDDQLENIPEFRNRTVLTSQIRFLGRNIKKNFAPEKIQDHLLII